MIGLCIVCIFFACIAIKIIFFSHNSLQNKKQIIFNQGDFVRTDWFLVEQTAEIKFISSDKKQVNLHVYPLMNNGKKYNSKLTGIDFLYLQEHTYWTSRERITRLATEKEINNVKEEYPYWKTK